MGLFDDEPFYRIGKLPPYVFAVINEMRAKARAAGLDIIDLGMGNPDGATPRTVVSKLAEAARNKRNHRYSMSRGIPRLRDEITKRYKTNYGVELDPEKEALVAMGAKDAIAHLLFAVIGPGDPVVTPDPSYPIHQWGVVMAEGEACNLAMPSPEEFLNRLEDLYRTSSKPPKMVLVSFPHNPTTHCVEKSFFESLVSMAHRHGTMIVHDFAYADLGFDGHRPPSILQVPGAKEVAVEIFSMSKSYNMAGWRIGFCLGNRKMIKCAGAHQKLPRLRRLPADSNRIDHRLARVRGRDEENPRRLSEAPRRAGRRSPPRRVDGGTPAGDDVSMGQDP